MSEEPDVAVEAEAPDESAAEAPESPPEAVAEDQLAELAKLSGWAPLDQWKGDPKDWLPPDKFVVKAVGEVLPSMRKSLNEAKSEIKTLNKALKEFGEHHTKTEQRAYDRASRDIQARLDEAAQNGDVQGVRDATKELVDLNTEAKAPRSDDTPQTDEHFDAWVEANPWWQADKAMTGAAIAIANEVETETGLKTGKRFFDEVTRRVKETFPTKFTPATNPRRQEPSAVEGDIPPRKAGKGWSDLSAEQKEMAIFFEKNVKGFKREDYVKDVFGAAK